jgi:DNA-binding Xre family transcriptional regulator
MYLTKLRAYIEKYNASLSPLEKEEKELTYLSIAYNVHRSQSTISNWCNGKSEIRYNDLQVLCRYLKCKPEDII